MTRSQNGMRAASSRCRASTPTRKSMRWSPTTARCGTKGAPASPWMTWTSTGGCDCATSLRTHRRRTDSRSTTFIWNRPPSTGSRSTTGWCPWLLQLLGERPAVCNSLSLEYGSEQEDHVDSLFMTPRTPAHLVAVWVALEDCAPESGLLRYWPGSHRIEPYVFSNGERHFIPEELGAWQNWMRAQVQQHGLRSELFGAHKGDVFIWNNKKGTEVINRYAGPPHDKGRANRVPPISARGRTARTFRTSRVPPPLRRKPENRFSSSRAKRRGTPRSDNARPHHPAPA